jgi:hypothetical protein
MAVAYPSAEGRLFWIVRMAEGWAFARGVVIGSVHKFGYGHKFGGASAAPVVA